MKSLANANGRIMPLADVMVPAMDRGFLFGDAVYEGLRAYNGRVWLLDEHWRRLAHSLDAIRIQGVDLERLRRRLQDTITAGQFKEAFVYVQVTRGSAPHRSHAFPDKTVPFEFLFVEEHDDSHYRELRKKGTSAVTFPDLRWKRCDIKSTNLLGNVLAAQAAKEGSGGEALLYQPDSTITECTRSSLFAVMDGKLVTAPLTSAILPGITRNFTLDLVRDLDVAIEERHLRMEQLSKLSELFLTGTTIEVLPIVQVDQKPIGTGKPGPVALRLLEAYQVEVRRWLEK